MGDATTASKEAQKLRAFQQRREIQRILQEVTALRAQVAEAMERTQHLPPAVKMTHMPSAVNTVDSGVDGLAAPEHEDEESPHETSTRYRTGQHIPPASAQSSTSPPTSTPEPHASPSLLLNS